MMLRHAKNPWGKDPLLSGWVPGISERLDMLAMIVSVSHAQWEIGRLMVRLSRMQAGLATLWALLAVLNVGYMMRWW